MIDQRYKFLLQKDVDDGSIADETNNENNRVNDGQHEM